MTNELNEKLSQALELLQLNCKQYDAGSVISAVQIATQLRVLVHDTAMSTSLLAQTGRKNNIQYVDSSIKHRGGISFWHIENVSNQVITVNEYIYAGLLKKTMTNGLNGKMPTLNFEPLLEANNHGSKWEDFDTWYKGQTMFEYGQLKMTRKDIICTLANKEGGAHVDLNYSDDYKYFKEPTMLDININGLLARFNQNPVYVSVRQIAWEVLESMKRVK